MSSALNGGAARTKHVLHKLTTSAARHQPDRHPTGTLVVKKFPFHRQRHAIAEN